MNRFSTDNMKLSADTLGAFLVREASRIAEPAVTTILSVPAPIGRPEALLRAIRSDDTFLWRPPTGPVFAGAGAVRTIREGGAKRFDSLREDADIFWKTVAEVRHPDCAPPLPALFGGFSFETESRPVAPWEHFADSVFTLPRWRYATDGGKGTLSLALHGPDDVSNINNYVLDLARILEALQTEPGAEAGAPSDSDVEIAPLNRTIWGEMIDSIHAGIEEDLFTKVVAARRTLVEFPEAIETLPVWTRLAKNFPDCYAFAFRRGDSTFLGASPERLVRMLGRKIATEALAGTIRADGSAEKRRERVVELLQSRKDLDEHELVVASIRSKLEPLCSELRTPPRPLIRELSNALHLHTPMLGKLSRRSHILNLMAVLHPTPSVGGVPTASATRWIIENEPHPRGWYAGPVGYFDSKGDGDFAVAIRSGIVRGSRAYLYAGSGIVRDSETEKEYKETDIKLIPLLRALGIRE